MNVCIESAFGLHGYKPAGMANSHGLLILMEPDGPVRDALQTLLTSEGWQVSIVESAKALAGQLECRHPVAVISESRLPGVDAHSVLADCLEQQIPLIFIGHERDVQQAVDLVQQGAAGYLEKPFSQARLLQLLEKLLGQLPDRHNKGATRQP